MQEVQWLTVWNVLAPQGFLADLPALWALDVRGGSDTDLAPIEGCRSLRFLQVNQVRGMSDLSVIASFQRLELLSVYGLPKVRTMPCLKALKRLKRLEIGSMKGLTSLTGALDAPALEELALIRSVALTDLDVDAIARHRTLRAFDWFAEDGPDRDVAPVKARLTHLARARNVHHEEWFATPRPRVARRRVRVTEFPGAGR